MKLTPKQLLAAMFVMFWTTFAWADPRPFTFTYDAYPIGKGAVELRAMDDLQRRQSQRT
jgi:hypothetical protein